MSNSQVMLTLVGAPSLAHDLVDFLLENTEGGYLSIRGAGHGTHEVHMSIVEQVAGRQSRDVYQIHLDQEAVQRLLEQLRVQFAGAGLHWWLSPVIDSGSI